MTDIKTTHNEGDKVFFRPGGEGGTIDTTVQGVIAEVITEDPDGWELPSPLYEVVWEDMEFEDGQQFDHYTFEELVPVTN